MEKWEEAGFASKAAWEANLVKKAEDAEARAKAAEEALKASEAAIETANAEAEAKAKADAEAAQKSAQEAEEAKKKEAQAKANMTDQEVEAANNKRIAGLSKEEQEALAKEYEAGTPEQKALLSTPRGVGAFLDMKFPKQKETYNPFKIREPELSIEDRIALAFGKAKESGAPAAQENKGTGFKKQPTDSAKQEIASRNKSVMDTVQSLRDRYGR
jgi:hypothetical protein